MRPAEEADAGAGAGEGAEPMDEEERLLAEMEAVKERMEHDAKKAKKKRREMKQKARVRSAQLAAAEGIGEDNQGVREGGREGMRRAGRLRWLAASGCMACCARAH